MSQTNDLTTGKIPAKLLGFFFPMLFTNLFQQVYAVADTAVIGKGLGGHALGAVGNLSALSLLVTGFLTGMTSGFSVIVAKNFGAGDTGAIRHSVGVSFRLSAVLTLLLTVSGCLFLRPLLLLMQTDEKILTDCLQYGYIIFSGLATTAGYNLCAGILRAAGDSKAPFSAIIFSSAVNIMLDYILIFLFHSGVGGAAIATVFSQGLSVLLCWRKIRQIPALRNKQSIPRTDTTMPLLLLKNGIPAACMNSVTAVGCMVVQGYINGYGAEYTSAYAVCSRYLNLFMLPSLTAGLAISAFVSQNLGAGRPERIRQGVCVSMHIALVSYLLLGSVAMFFSEQLAGFMLNESGTATLAAGYLRICGAGLLLLNLLFIFRNAAQGMGHPFIPMLSGIAEMALRIPAVIYLLPLIGFRAAAYAEIAAWVGALTLNAADFVIGMNRAKK